MRQMDGRTERLTSCDHQRCWQLVCLAEEPIRKADRETDCLIDRFSTAVNLWWFIMEGVLKEGAVLDVIVLRDTFLYNECDCGTAGES